MAGFDGSCSPEHLQITKLAKAKIVVWGLIASLPKSCRFGMVNQLCTNWACGTWNNISCFFQQQSIFLWKAICTRQRSEMFRTDTKKSCHWSTRPANISVRVPYIAVLVLHSLGLLLLPWPLDNHRSCLKSKQIFSMENPIVSCREQEFTRHTPQQLFSIQNDFAVSYIVSRNRWIPKFCALEPIGDILIFSNQRGENPYEPL